MTNSATSHLLPVFARVDLGFERGEGCLADRHQWRALSRLHLGRRGECAGSLPSASGRGAAGAGDKALAHVEPVQEPGWREARRAAVRAELCRHRVLLQFRRRSDGRRDQGRAPLSILQGPSRALSPHHLRGRVPRPHAGHARRDRLRQISRRLWPADGRFRPGAAWRSRSGEKGDRAAHRRHPDRAGAGRGRRALRAACLLQGAAPALRRARACCWRSTRCRPAWAAPAISSPTSASA